jgi:hypothetical protein
MERENEVQKISFNIVAYRVEFIRIKSLATVALKHLESVTDEDIPKDAEFRQILWILESELVSALQDLESMHDALGLAEVDDRVIPGEQENRC